MAQDFWLRAAEEIMDNVSNAVNTGDFSGLSNSVENTVHNISNVVANKTTYVVHGQQKPHGYRENAPVSSWGESYQNRNKPINEGVKSYNVHYGGEPVRSIVPANNKKLVGFKNSLMLAGGALIGTGFGIGAIVSLVFTILSFVGGGIVSGILLTVLDVILLGCAGGGAYLANTANGNIKLHDRFKKYVEVFGAREYAPIKLLADSIGKSESYVKKDLNRLMDKGLFVQGHFDDQEQTFLLTDKAYNDYRENQIKRYEYEQEQKANDAEVEKLPENVRNIIKEGNEYIAYIREANSRIPDAVVTAKLNTLEDIVSRIFDRLKKQPESAEDLRKLMKYYLPTTRKLLDAYIELDAQPSYGSNNIENTKREIENTIDIINDAFAKLFDSMYQDTAWDISSDISTMKTMMAQEGLTGGNDFNK